MQAYNLILGADGAQEVHFQSVGLTRMESAAMFVGIQVVSSSLSTIFSTATRQSKPVRRPAGSRL